MSMRELSNTGYLYPEEQEWVNSGTRRKRSCTKAVRYNFEEEVATSVESKQSQTVEPTERPRAPSISVAYKKKSTPRVKLSLGTEQNVKTEKSPNQSPASPKTKTLKDASRKRSAQDTPPTLPRTPKRRKATGSISHHFSGDVVKSIVAATKKGAESPNIVRPVTPKLPTPKSEQSSSNVASPEDLTETGQSPTLGRKNSTSKRKTAFINKDDVRVRFTLPQPAPSEEPSKLSTDQLTQISNKLHELTKRQEPKPEPTGKPLVWSESRRELCEALPYYRSYKGGGYTFDGVAHAFMFDSVAHARDYIDSTVVIARAGGGMASEGKGGPMVLSRDQDATAQVRALESNMREFRPVGIIAGEKLSNMQSHMKHRYQLLDWFKPTDIWCEKTNGHVAVRYRFEKLRTYEPSWWTPAGEGDEIAEIQENIPRLVVVSSPCQACSKISSQVYINGWMCLHPTCRDFWKLSGSRDPDKEELRYDPRFLKRRTIWPHSSIPWETVPDSFNLSRASIQGDITLEDVGEITKSIVCPKCGRCTSAKYWTYWICGNAQCRMKVELPRTNLTPAALQDITRPLTSEYAFSNDWYDSSIVMEPLFIGNYRVQRYTLPGIDGYVAHMIANKTIVEEPGGPDDMFTDLQNNEIGLERREKGDTRIAGENLFDHFTKNYGMPYKFVASPDSEPFSKAPQSVLMARSQMNWVIKALGITDKPDFNELMVLGYKTANKIGYHDDGEDGLGPTVATLSVGAPAEMKLRMHEKYFRGYSGKDDGSRVGTKLFVDKLPPIPGGVEYERRMDACTELQKLKETDLDAYRTRKKTLPQELGLASGKPRTAPEVLKMKLYHGDIVIMHGALIQSYYVHCVEPKGKMRFAFTCRNILENHLKPEEMPEYDVEEDSIGYDGFKLPRPQ